MRRLWPLVVLCAVTVVAYSNALGNPLIFDDGHLILDNAWLRDRRFLGTLWTAHTETPSGIYPHYRPLFLLSLWTNWQLGGAAPWLYRLTNLAIHLGNGVAGWLVVRRFARELGADERRAERAATFAAAVFLLHPINSIVLHQVAKRSTSLVVLELLVGLLLWMRSSRWPAVIAVACIGGLAVLTKEEGVLLPALVVLWELVRGRSWRDWAPRAAVLLVLPAVYVAFLLPHGVAQSTEPRMMLAYALSQPIALGWYLRMLVNPDAIAAAYQLEYAIDPLPWSRFVLLAAALAGLGLVFARRRRVPLVAAAIAWAAVLLAPSSSVLSPPVGPMDESRCYVAFLLLYGAVGVAAARLQAFIAHRLSAFRTARFVAVAPFLVVCTLMMSATLRENARWGDSIAVFAHAVERYPKSQLANANLCDELVAHGEFETAIPQCRRAIELAPYDPYPACALMQALARLGQLDEADTAIRAAEGVTRDPAPILQCEGALAWFRGDLTRARRRYEQVLALNPQSDQARVYLADVLERQGERARAAALVHSFDGAPPLKDDQRRVLAEVAARLSR